MKRLTSVILLILIVLVAQAQTAREEIKANRQLSANNYYAYPTPTVKQKAAPEGYEPFYISTYARHGSRYLIDPNDYLFPKQVLLKADSLNKLTAKGKVPEYCAENGRNGRWKIRGANCVGSSPA